MIAYLLALSALMSALQPTTVANIASKLPELLDRPYQIETTAKEVKEVVQEIKTVWITAYSSTPEQTDDTPFVTASGTKVRNGVIASNFLEFGTKVQIPEIFGDRMFVVEDRMHPRKSNFVDVWMPSKEDALKFGIYQARIVVLKDI